MKRCAKCVFTLKFKSYLKNKSVIFNYFLIRFAQTKITLFIFFNNWVSKEKRKFSASRAVFSFNTLPGNKVNNFPFVNISLSVQSIPY